jgi:hypothetical protein
MSPSGVSHADIANKVRASRVKTIIFMSMVLSALGLICVPSAQAQFDFRLEVNAATITIPQGSTGINVLHATLLSGSPLDVTLTASGLPAGVTVSFQDNTIRFDRDGGHPPFGSTYSIYVNVGASTPTGSHQITITAARSGINRNTQFQLTVAPVTGTQIRYVAPSGSNGAAGTSGAPWQTIQHALNNVSAGWTVVVRAGTYFERLNVVTSGTSGSPITFVGEVGAIIDGSQVVSGWSPSGIASGAYEKSTGSMPFTPGSVTWNGKTGGWALENNPVGVESPSTVITRSTGDYRLEALGAIGYTDGVTTYLRLSNNADPDSENVRFGTRDVPTININNRHWNTFTGFTIQNGHNQVEIHHGATGNVIRHNRILGGQHTVYLRDGVSQTLIHNNDITLNHNYNDMGHPINITVLDNFLYGWHRKSMLVHQKYSALMTEITTSTQIYENHIYRHFAGVNGLGDDGVNQDLRVFRNYIHHTNAYAFEFKQFGDFTWMHDNILYENTENFRIDAIPSSSTVYFYRNRLLSLSTSACGCVYDFSTSPAHVDMIIPGTQATFYIYHNSFNGNGVGLYLYGGQGATNVWIVNNIFSASQPLVIENGGDPGQHYNYNWVGGAEAISHVDLFGGDTSENVINQDQRMWNTVNPSFLQAAGALSIGIDTGESWSLDGDTNPALPGMVAAAGSPDAGWAAGAAPVNPCP